MAVNIKKFSIHAKVKEKESPSELIEKENKVNDEKGFQNISESLKKEIIEECIDRMMVHLERTKKI